MTIEELKIMRARMTQGAWKTMPIHRGYRQAVAAGESNTTICVASSNDAPLIAAAPAILSELIELREKKEEIAEALIGMYEQYCPDGHSFMNAGERASTVLEMQGYAGFDTAGRMTFLEGESTGEKK